MKTELQRGNVEVKGIVLLFMVAITVLFSCAGTVPTAVDRDVIIVQANLFAGRPVNDVRLFYLIKEIIDSTEMTINNWQTNLMVDTVLYTLCERGVEDAQVTVLGNGESYPLTYSDSGWYFEASGMLMVVAGETYRIDVYTEEKHVWAETTVPLPVSGLVVAQGRDTLYVDTTLQGSGSGSSSGGSSGRPKISSGAASNLGSDIAGPEIPTVTSAVPDSLSKLMVTWDNPNGMYMYFWCELETNPDPIIVRKSFTNTSGLTFSTVRSSGSSSGGGGSGSTSRTINLTTPGRYKLLIYTPPPERDYWNMIAARPDTSSLIQDRWTRAFTNVRGGTGYFASFGIDSVFFTIAPWTEVGL